MQRLEDMQGEFSAALLDAGRPLPGAVTSHTAETPVKRFNVYRNNVAVSLIDALEDRYPVITRLIGAEAFRAAARAHVLAEPPVSPVLLEYGSGFPAFLDTLEPLADLPYLRDVARLEDAWLKAYHAADREPLDAAAFAGIDPQRMGDVVFEFHPSVHILHSQFPMVSIWETNTGDDEVKEISLDAGGEDALIVRPQFEVEVRHLPPGGFAFIAVLQNGRPLGEAAARAGEVAPAFDLQDNLVGLMASGAIAGYRFAGEK